MALTESGFDLAKYLAKSEQPLTTHTYEGERVTTTYYQRGARIERVERTYSLTCPCCGHVVAHTVSDTQ